MRYLRYLILAAIAIALVVVALANRDIVTLRLLPEGLDTALGFNASVQVPLFLVILAGVVIGLMIGFIWEWLREMKLRGAARQEHKQVVRLEREVDRLKSEKHQGKDDVLALIDDI